MKINFKHKYYDQTFIINFLSIYKINRNKTSLSDKELQNIININVIININNKTKNWTYLFLKVIDSQNIELVNFLMNYTIKNDIIIRKNNII